MISMVRDHAESWFSARSLYCASAHCRFSQPAPLVSKRQPRPFLPSAVQSPPRLASSTRRGSVTQYSGVHIAWSCDSEHGAFLEAAFGISRRRRGDWKAWSAGPTDAASCRGVKAGEPGCSGPNPPVRLRLRSPGVEGRSGQGGGDSRDPGGRTVGLATGRGGVAVARRGPAGLVLCVIRGTRGS